MNPSAYIQEPRNHYNVLRDDGMSFGDYVEQLTDLLSLSMADERSRPPYHQASPIAAAYAWPGLLAKDGDALFDHYRHTLEELGKQPGTMALIFGKAQNKTQGLAKLRRVIVDVIDAENWSATGADVKGDAYEDSARAQRAGHQVRRRPVLHAARVDPGRGGLHRPASR